MHGVCSIAFERGPHDHGWTCIGPDAEGSVDPARRPAPTVRSPRSPSSADARPDDGTSEAILDEPGDDTATRPESESNVGDHLGRAEISDLRTVDRCVAFGRRGKSIRLGLQA